MTQAGHGRGGRMLTAMDGESRGVADRPNAQVWHRENDLRPDVVTSDGTRARALTSEETARLFPPPFRIAEYGPIFVGASPGQAWQITNTTVSRVTLKKRLAMTLKQILPGHHLLYAASDGDPQAIACLLVEGSQRDAHRARRLARQQPSEP